MREITLCATLLLVGGGGLFGQGQPTPQTSRLEPRLAKPGTVLTITGVALDRSQVDEIYLTDHRFDMKVKVLEQTDTTLKIRVPGMAKPGRQQLLLLTKGDAPVLLEMPVFVTIEAGDEEQVASVGGR